jgi:hypothetical protein
MPIRHGEPHNISIFRCSSMEMKLYLAFVMHPWWSFYGLFVANRFHGGTANIQVMKLGSSAELPILRV